MREIIKEQYERGLTERQIENLCEGVLKPILDIVKSSDDYQIEFRDKYFNVYYKGGSLLKIEGIDKPHFSFDMRYCQNTATKYSTKISSIQKTDIENLAKNIDLIKYEMNAWFLEYPKKERELQQQLCIHNRRSEKELYIVDIEFAATGDGRADMLAVKQNQNGKYKIYLIEYKQGNAAISSGLKQNENGKIIATKSGLFKHYVDAANLVKKRKQALINTARNSMLTRNKLKISNFNAADLAFDDEMEMLFVLSDYKENKRVYKNPQVSDNLKKEIAAINDAQKTLDLKYRIIQLEKECYKIEI